MKHVYLKGKNNHAFILLHGTGGDEYQLLDLAKQIDDQAHLIGIRGRVVENGMNRYFKRITHGVFDLESLKEESTYLYDLILKLLNDYDIDTNNVTIIGYSNGANIALNLLLNHPFIAKNIVLLKPMPLNNEVINTKIDTNVFISAGINDPLTTKENSELIYKTLKGLNCEVRINYYNSAHSISNQEIVDIRKWLNKEV